MARFAGDSYDGLKRFSASARVRACYICQTGQQNKPADELETIVCSPVEETIMRYSPVMRYSTIPFCIFKTLIITAVTVFGLGTILAKQDVPPQRLLGSDHGWTAGGGC